MQCIVNQMCILNNSKDLLEYIQSRSLSSCNNIKTFDFSTLYKYIPHSKKLQSTKPVYEKKKSLYVSNNYTNTSIA